MSLQVRSSSRLTTRAGIVHVDVAGRGDRQLLAVTPIGAAWMIAAFPSELEDVFTIHVMELPGTGRSPYSPECGSVEAVTDAIGAVAGKLADPPVLFGESMNGTLVLAASQEVACERVIAVTPPPRLPPDPSVSAAYWEANADDERRVRATAIIAAYEAESDPARRDELRAAYDRLRRWHDLDADHGDLEGRAVMSMEWIEAMFESGAGVDWTATMRSIDRPVLLALGASDYIAPPTAWTDDNTPPHATVEVFPRSGHTPYVEEPEAFVDAVRRWLPT